MKATLGDEVAAAYARAVEKKSAVDTTVDLDGVKNVAKAFFTAVKKPLLAEARVPKDPFNQGNFHLAPASGFQRLLKVSGTPEAPEWAAVASSSVAKGIGTRARIDTFDVAAVRGLEKLLQGAPADAAPAPAALKTLRAAFRAAGFELLGLGAGRGVLSPDLDWYVAYRPL